MEKTYTLRDTTLLTNTVKVCLILGVVAAAISALSSWWQLQLLAQEIITEAEAEANDAREATIGIVEFIIIIVTGIVFLRWIYVSHQNVRATGAKGLSVSPGWAVGYFFIPIVCLWKPYKAMKELWQASADPLDWREVECGPLLGIWWTLWIAVTVLARAAIRISIRAEEVADFMKLTVAQLANEVGDIALGLAAFYLVLKIHQFQSHPNFLNTNLREEPVGSTARAWEQ
ncbi:MAG: DUF4328 domain-containing protein [Chloroflexi bacterium]|nr:DUF4328 domain-containing protein [Chloroflexota bacterium]